MVAPVVEQFARQYPAIRVVKLHTDANPRTSQKYSVMSIPTLILFVSGREAKRITGALPLPQLIAELQPWL